MITDKFNPPDHLRQAYINNRVYPAFYNLISCSIDSTQILTEQEFKAGKPGYVYLNSLTNKIEFKG